MASLATIFVLWRAPRMLLRRMINAPGILRDLANVSPPLIATERDFGEIRARIAAMLAVLE